MHVLERHQKGATHTSLPGTKMFLRLDGISMPVTGAPVPARSAAALLTAKRLLAGFDNSSDLGPSTVACSASAPLQVPMLFLAFLEQTKLFSATSAQGTQGKALVNG